MMNDVTVYVAAALICFGTQCAPALVGSSTPTGVFGLHQRMTDQPGYGGDVLQFDDQGDRVFAIHRVWLLDPSQRRTERLTSGDPAQRLITNGCVNVSPTVYQRLVDCCSDATLRIEP